MLQLLLDVLTFKTDHHDKQQCVMIKIQHEQRPLYFAEKRAAWEG